MKDVTARIVENSEHGRTLYFFSNDKLTGGASVRYSWLFLDGKTFMVMNSDRSVGGHATTRRFFKFANALACIDAFMGDPK